MKEDYLNTPITMHSSKFFTYSLSNYYGMFGRKMTQKYEGRLVLRNKFPYKIYI